MDGNGEVVHRNGGGEGDTAEKHSSGKDLFTMIDASAVKLKR